MRILLLILTLLTAVSLQARKPQAEIYNGMPEKTLIQLWGKPYKKLKAGPANFYIYKGSSPFSGSGGKLTPTFIKLQQGRIKLIGKKAEKELAEARENQEVKEVEEDEAYTPPQRQFYVHVDGTNHGLMNRADVIRGLRKGTYLPSHYAWTEGEETWSSLEALLMKHPK